MSPAPARISVTLGVGLRGHLLDPADQHHVVQPGRDARNRVEKRRAAGGAGSLKSRARDSGDSHRAGDVGSQVILAHKRRSREVAEVKSLYL